MGCVWNIGRRDEAFWGEAGKGFRRVTREGKNIDRVAGRVARKTEAQTGCVS